MQSRRTAILFTILALGFSVVYWLFARYAPFSFEHAGFARKSVPGTIVWLLFDNFGPALAAVIALAVCQGRQALADLGRSLLRWRVRGRLWVLGWFMIVVNVGVVIVGLATHSLHFDPSGFAPLKFVLLYFVMIAVDGPLGEEIGWRGVLLPQLLRTMSPRAAALIVGVIWYAWHVPLYAAEDKLPGAFEHVFFLYTCVALSIIFTWFFLKSNGSTLLMIYLHQASNYSTFVRFKVFPKTTQSIAPMLAYGAVLGAIALGVCASKTMRRGVPDAEAGPTNAAGRAG